MELELSTDQKGAIAESAIVHAATKLGIGVYVPFSDGERYDLIFDLGRRLVRVQCKWAPRQGDVVIVRAYSCRRTADGLRRRGYGAEEIDAIAAYCPELDRCYYLPGSEWWVESRSSCASLRAATIKRGASTGRRISLSSGYDSTFPGP